MNLLRLIGGQYTLNEHDAPMRQAQAHQDGDAGVDIQWRPA
jgi:hypothetical protein